LPGEPLRYTLGVAGWWFLLLLKRELKHFVQIAEAPLFMVFECGHYFAALQQNDWK